MYRRLPESTADQQFEVNVQASNVAQSCRDVLQAVGHIKSMSRESGIILGEISNGIFTSTVVTIKISKISDSRTQINVNMVRHGRGIQDNMAKFTDRLFTHPNLVGKTTSIW